MSGKRLGIDVAETVGPAAVMLNDLVDNLGHTFSCLCHFPARQNAATAR